MNAAYSDLKEIPLHLLCLPGTHNSAASAHYAPLLNRQLPAENRYSDYERQSLLGRSFTRVAAWGVQDLPASVVQYFAAGWAICQRQSITAQLESGVRYFDLRLYYDIWLAGWRITHNGMLLGPSLRMLIDEFLAFLANHPGELLIIDLGEVAYMDDQDRDVRSARLIQELKRLEPHLTAAQGPTLPTFGELWTGPGPRASKVLLCGQVPTGLPRLASELLLNNWQEAFDVAGMFTRFAANAAPGRHQLVRNALQPSWWKQGIVDVIKTCSTNTLASFNQRYLPQIRDFMLNARRCLGGNFRPSIVALDFQEDLDFVGTNDGLARLCYNLNLKSLALGPLEAVEQLMTDDLEVAYGRDAAALAACGSSIFLSGGVRRGDIDNHEEVYRFDLASANMQRLTGNVPWTKALAAYPDAFYAISLDRFRRGLPWQLNDPLPILGSADTSWGRGTFVRMAQAGDTLYIAADDKIYWCERNTPLQAYTLPGDWSWLRGLACLNGKVYAYRGDDLFCINPAQGYTVTKLTSHGWPSTFSLVASRRYLYLIFDEAFHRYDPDSGAITQITERYRDLRAGCCVDALSAQPGGACLAFLAGTQIRLLFVRED